MGGPCHFVDSVGLVWDVPVGSVQISWARLTNSRFLIRADHAPAADMIDQARVAIGGAAAQLVWLV